MKLLTGMLNKVPNSVSRYILFSYFLFIVTCSPVALASECMEGVAQAVSIQGRLEVFSASNNEGWKKAEQGEHFCPGDQLRVGANSRVGLILNDDTLLRLGENSGIILSASTQERNWLDLLRGIAHFISRTKRSFQVNTPYVNASIEGTEFTVESNQERARVTVLEGQVRAHNDQGEVFINGGEQAVSNEGQAPWVETVVNPMDAVRWALYYPAIIDLGVDRLTTAESRDIASQQPIERSQDAYRRGDLSTAFKALSEIPSVAQDNNLLIYRASLYLQVGRTDAAQRDLNTVLLKRRGDTRALALRSIIATVLNESEAALSFAKQSIKADPQAGSGHLALSYAQQAQFQLEEALASAQQAVTVESDNALAWSRLAQLHLMFRHLDEAGESAQRAVEIATNQSQTQTTLGYTRLIELDLQAAREAFEKAISLDQATPLPRLGLGLVVIRQGDLTGGRRIIETAANLDPGNALIRSYLGKAYYEEKRDKQAAIQFQLAKQFDEQDPTAWFYDAIRKQAANRPGEALEDMQTSIALNDNRAVYRSSFLLDQDEAARNASQARIYKDLGFDQLALTEAYKSLQTSPQTHSAHRLLSDSYASRPRYGGARVSELLQSQLLQPLNTTPIQPQLAASNLGILDGAGPSDSGYAEYTPLFTRNGFDIQFNAIGGSNNTLGEDLVVSGLHDRISYSLGQFHYKTDGWRKNNDLKQNIYDAFLQASLSPTTSIQFEYRYQDAESGDLAFIFEPENFSSVERNETERQLGRMGIHHQPTPTSDIIASIIYQDTQQTWGESYSITDPAYYTDYGPLPAITDYSDIISADSIERTTELQFIQRIDDHVFTLGTGYFDESLTIGNTYQDTTTILNWPDPPYYFIEDWSEPTFVEEMDHQYKNIYLYSLIKLPSRMNMTLGASYADFKRSVGQNDQVDTDQVDPKFGLTWEAWRNVIVRAAYFESLTRPLHMAQTIEPTQVAGFNQIFDDEAGSKIKHFGMGVDAKLSDSLSIGAEFNQRELQVPIIALTRSVDTILEERDEKRYFTYAYWRPINNFSVRLTYENEQLEGALTAQQRLKTQRLPIGFSYHWPSGIFAQAVGTHIKQEITRSGVTEQETFWNIDGTFGYRFPKQLGKAEIIIKNLLDKEFRYYDMSFQQSDEPLPPQFQPTRQIFARFTIDF